MEGGCGSGSQNGALSEIFSLTELYTLKKIKRQLTTGSIVVWNVNVSAMHCGANSVAFG